MTKYRQIGIDGSTFLSPGGQPGILDQVHAAIAAGEMMTIRPNSFFPASFTMTKEPAYEVFAKGCGNLRARGMIRIEIVSPLLAGRGGALPFPEQNTDRARVVRLSVPPGETLSLPNPGALLRSPAGFSAGIPGGQVTKYGVLKDSAGHGDKGPKSATLYGPRVDLGGAFTYTADKDAPLGAVEDIEFLLIDTNDGFRQPYDAQPYFDPETHPEYCGLNNVPSLKHGDVLGYGVAVANALLPYRDHIAYWSAPVNEPEYRVFYPKRLKEEDNAPDLDALYDEVYAPFMDGLMRRLWRDGMYAGPDTGSIDVLKWWLVDLPAFARDIITHHIYVGADESLIDGVTRKLDEVKALLDSVGWRRQLFLSEFLVMPRGPVATPEEFPADKWAAVLPVLKARPWVTAVFNPLSGLMETIA